MTPEIVQFLYLNGTIVLLLAAYILFWRPKRTPTRLKLRGPAKGLSQTQSEPSASQKSRASAASNARDNAVASQGAPRVRQLTVYFQFNGHDFESYEVLGLPAGSSFEVVEKTFRALLAKEPPDSHDFYRKAFEAIRAQR
jgi:hypothetical protein